MPQRKPPEGYYTAAQVKQILNITDGMLYNFIDNGALTRIIPPGRKQGVYSKYQVEQLGRDLQVFINTREERHTSFAKATREDIPLCLALGIESYPLYPQEVASIETRLKWLDKNPDLFYVVKHKGEIVGYTGIIPMTPEKIMRILDDKDLFKDIKPEEIEKLEPGNTYSIYINTMRTKANISRLQKRAYGVRLIGGLMTVILEMIEKGINFDTLYARSETVDGIRLLKHMGFQEIPSITQYKNFSLKLHDHGLQNLQKYQQAVERRQMPEEQFKALFRNTKEQIH